MVSIDGILAGDDQRVIQCRKTLRNTLQIGVKKNDHAGIRANSSCPAFRGLEGKVLAYPLFGRTAPRR